MKMKTNSFKNYWEKFGTLAIFVVMWCVFAVVAPASFHTAGNFIQIVTQSATIMLLACGEFFAILLGGIDLSIGSIVAFTGMVTAKLMVNFGMNPFLAVLLGAVLGGALCGFINGTLINLTGVHPFIITLGTQSIFRALTLIISNAQATFGMPKIFTQIFGGLYHGVPMAVVIALVVAVLCWFIASKLTFGRNLYVMGGNRDAAWFSGINVKQHLLAVHTISGLCAGICGAVMAARLGAAEPNTSIGAETEAIASAIIGGTSFFGGKGKIPNVIVGALILGLISNGLNMCSVPTFYQNLATGLLLIAAVSLDHVVSRK